MRRSRRSRASKPRCGTETRFRSFLPSRAAGSPSRPADPRWRVDGADRGRMILTSDELQRVHAQAMAEYPSECCGVLLERSGPEPDRLLMPGHNIQDEPHAKDPDRP